MMHVPGQYSGGSGAGFSWDQTLQEVAIKVPLAAGATSSSVRCTFTARTINLALDEVGTSPLPSSEELSAVIVTDMSLWVVEKDGGVSTLVLTLHKAVPAVWDRLFASDAAPDVAPELLDGPTRTKPQSKAELLKQAKARLADELDGPSRAKPFKIENLTGVTKTITKSEEGMPELPVLIVSGCKGCTLTLAPELIAIKVQVEHCEDTTVDVQARALTETVEVWQCERTSVRLGVAAKTVQIDKCTDLKMTYAEAGFFDRIMSTGARKTTIAFEDAAELGTAVDFDALQAERPETPLSDDIDQFITRRLTPTGALTTELVIRLCNEFPTTEREVREFEQRTKMHADKLDEVVDGMLGSSLGKTLTAQEREQMKTMLKEQADQASQAQAHAEQTVEGRFAARVEFKKKQGNEAFKAAEFQQAAVFYTEALSLDAQQHTIYSNRAACFLKLGRYVQAREDAEACIKLAPDFAKGHFRLALALQAEEKAADACAAFTKVLELEPKNKDAAAGLNMARMQAERARRMQAGEINLS